MEELVTPEVVRRPVQTVSNMSEEEFKKRVAEFEARRKEQKLEAQRSNSCPVCAARKNREQIIHRFENDIIQMLHSVSLVSLDSCILCVQKHISRAMTYYEEMLTASNSGMSDGTASVNMKINHLKVLGHLGCAIEESDDFTELHQLLIDYERAYRYEGISPDWKKLAAEIVKVEESQKKQAAVTEIASQLVGVIKVK